MGITSKSWCCNTCHTPPAPDAKDHDNDDKAEEGHIDDDGGDGCVDVDE